MRDYALLADGERGALIGPRGDLAWLCLPAWDSDAVFSTLIGGSGYYAITPVDPFTWGGYYDRRSLVWNSRWVTTRGIVESREALALPGDLETAVILRRITVVEGVVRLRVVLDVRAGFGVEAMRRTHRDEDGIWTGRSGAVRFRWSGAQSAHRARLWAADLRTRSRRRRDVTTSSSSSAKASWRRRSRDADALWSSTEEGWREAVPELGDDLLGRRDAEHAMAVLRGLTSAHGGMVAAATMSLPERADQNRNYDYRYAWIRDQCYAGIAVARHGHFPLLDSAVNFVSERLLADGPALKPAYTVRGGPVPSERALSHLQGYPEVPTRLGTGSTSSSSSMHSARRLSSLRQQHRCDRLDAAIGTRSRWRLRLSNRAGKNPTRVSGRSTRALGALAPHVRLRIAGDRGRGAESAVRALERARRWDPG